jgi:hypothetical protein
VDESEISGEERPTDNINMIPNSQVARPQEGLMNTSVCHVQQQPPQKRSNVMVEGQAVEALLGDAVLNQSSMLYNHSVYAHPLEGAQQYTMKSMTLNNMNVDSSDNGTNFKETNYKENKSEVASPSVAIGLYYQGGAVLQLLPSAQNSTS